jgi:hypothetical protein
MMLMALAMAGAVQAQADKPAQKAQEQVGADPRAPGAKAPQRPPPPRTSLPLGPGQASSPPPAAAIKTAPAQEAPKPVAPSR